MDDQPENDKYEQYCARRESKQASKHTHTHTHTVKMKQVLARQVSWLDRLRHFSSLLPCGLRLSQLRKCLIKIGTHVRAESNSCSSLN